MSDDNLELIGFAAIMVCIGVLLIPYIFYLITLQKTLQAVSLENRKMKPRMVWLLLIPVFTWVWLFFVVRAISDSLKLEFNKYGVIDDEKPTYDVGFSLAISRCCLIIPILGGFAGLASFVMWIIYWVQINQKKNELINVINNRKSLEPSEKSIFM